MGQKGRKDISEWRELRLALINDSKGLRPLIKFFLQDDRNTQVAKYARQKKNTLREEDDK